MKAHYTRTREPAREKPTPREREAVRLFQISTSSGPARESTKTGKLLNPGTQQAVEAKKVDRDVVAKGYSWRNGAAAIFRLPLTREPILRTTPTRSHQPTYYQATRPAPPKISRNWSSRNKTKLQKTPSALTRR